MASTDALATSSSAMTTSDSNGKVSQTQTQYFSRMSTAAIQDLIDGGVENMSKPWTGSVKFKFHVCRSYDMTNLPAIFNSPPEKLDLCDFIGGKDPLSLARRLYFCPTTYTPPASNNIPRDHTAWIDLKRDIEKACHEGGNVIISNGGIKGTRIFKCGQCYRSERKSRAQDITAENPMRKTSLVQCIVIVALHVTGNIHIWMLVVDLEQLLPQGTKSDAHVKKNIIGFQIPKMILQFPCFAVESNGLRTRSVCRASRGFVMCKK